MWTKTRSALVHSWTSLSVPRHIERAWTHFNKSCIVFVNAAWREMSTQNNLVEWSACSLLRCVLHRARKQTCPPLIFFIWLILKILTYLMWTIQATSRILAGFQIIDFTLLLFIPSPKCVWIQQFPLYTVLHNNNSSVMNCYPTQIRSFYRRRSKYLLELGINLTWVWWRQHEVDIDVEVMNWIQFSGCRESVGWPRGVGTRSIRFRLFHTLQKPSKFP